MTKLINFFKKPYVSLKPWEFLKEKNDYIKLSKIDNGCFSDLHSGLKILESLKKWDDADYDSLDYTEAHNNLKDYINSSRFYTLLIEKAIEYTNQIDKNLKPSKNLKEAFKKIKKVLLVEMKTKEWIGPPIDFNNDLEVKETLLSILNNEKTLGEMTEKRFEYLDNKEFLSDRKKYKAALKELHIKQKDEYKEYFEMQSKTIESNIYNYISKEKLLYGLSHFWKEKKIIIQFALDNLKEIEPENYQKADNAFKEVCAKYDKYLN